MSQMSKLTVLLEAQTTQFQRAMQQQTGAISRFQKGVGRAATALAGLFAARAAIGFARSILAGADAMAKQARVLQMSVMEMQSYSLAAQHAGMSTRQLETATRQLQQRIGAVNAGLKSAESGFAALGLTRAEVQGRRVADVMKLIGDRLKTVDAETGQFALREMFGRSAQMMGEMIKNADNARRIVEETYAAMGRTGASVKSIEDLNDAVATAKTRIGIMAQVIMSDLAPALEKMVNLSARSASGVGRLFQAIGAKYEMDGIIGIGRAIFDINGTLQSFDNHLVALEKRTGFDIIQAQAKAAHDAMEDAARAAEDAARQHAEYLESLDSVAAKIMQDARPATQVYAETMRDLNAMMQEGMIDAAGYEHAHKQAWETYEQAFPAIERARKLTEQYADTVAVLTKEMDELKELSEIGLLSEETATRGMQALQDQINELDPAFVALRDHMEELAQAGQDAFERTRTPFEKLQNELAKLDELWAHGKVSADTYARAVEDAISQSGIMEPADSQQSQAAGATTAGGFASVLAQSRVGAATSKEDMQIEEQRRMRTLLEQIARNTQTQVIAYG